MFEFRVILNAYQFILHKFHNILLDLSVICSYLLFHCIIAVLVQKAADFAWKIFCSIVSPKLSATAPTNIPCESVLILLAGIRLSSWVLIEVDVSLRLMLMDSRF